LEDYLEGTVNTVFRFAPAAGLDGKARDSIDKLLFEARSTLGMELVRGFLEQFSATEQGVIAKAVLVAAYPMKIIELSRKIAGVGTRTRNFHPSDDSIARVRKTFTNAWRNLRERSFSLCGNALPLIILRGHHYQENLSTILKTLRPELSNERISEWHRQMLRFYIGPVVDEYKLQS
jgi:hypothetical protein